ncbi:hypothetical protein ACSNOI_30030 [Actinomadura kijaniata]|uniref:hypothetical protein n=1 Tax=Actinomadura kijaniata TaxID=46161 RepID=UPI003F195A7F
MRFWLVWLLERHSGSYADSQCRALRQFFKWWSADEELPDPMAKLRPPSVGEKIVPVFTGEELAKPLKHCEGKIFVQRRDYAILMLLRIRYEIRADLHQGLLQLTRIIICLRRLRIAF